MAVLSAAVPWADHAGTATLGRCEAAESCESSRPSQASSLPRGQAPGNRARRHVTSPGSRPGCERRAGKPKLCATAARGMGCWRRWARCRSSGGAAWVSGGRRLPAGFGCYQLWAQAPEPSVGAGSPQRGWLGSVLSLRCSLLRPVASGPGRWHRCVPPGTLPCAPSGLSRAMPEGFCLTRARCLRAPRCCVGVSARREPRQPLPTHPRSLLHSGRRGVGWREAGVCPCSCLSPAPPVQSSEVTAQLCRKAAGENTKLSGGSLPSVDVLRAQSPARVAAACSASCWASLPAPCPRRWIRNAAALRYPSRWCVCGTGLRLLPEAEVGGGGGRRWWFCTAPGRC